MNFWGYDPVSPVWADGADMRVPDSPVDVPVSPEPGDPECIAESPVHAGRTSPGGDEGEGWSDDTLGEWGDAVPFDPTDAVPLDPTDTVNEEVPPTQPIPLSECKAEAPRVQRRRLMQSPIDALYPELMEQVFTFLAMTEVIVICSLVTGRWQRQVSASIWDNQIATGAPRRGQIVILHTNYPKTKLNSEQLRRIQRLIVRSYASLHFPRFCEDGALVHLKPTRLWILGAPPMSHNLSHVRGITEEVRHLILQGNFDTVFSQEFTTIKKLVQLTIWKQRGTMGCISFLLGQNPDLVALMVRRVESMDWRVFYPDRAKKVRHLSVLETMLPQSLQPFTKLRTLDIDDFTPQSQWNDEPTPPSLREVHVHGDITPLVSGDDMLRLINNDIAIVRRGDKINHAIRKIWP